MELIERLLFGSESLWGGGVAHSVLILALVVALGVMLGKLKVAGVSLGVTYSSISNPNGGHPQLRP